MAIQVWGWKKPTLEVSLVSGGTLLANTKYYVVGYMKFDPFVYNAVGSPLSDVYEITTTTTDKTISILQKTYRDITNFASAGGSVTTITSALHCLATGDQIKIATGSYIGTWTVTKINKDTFTIPTAYIDNVAVQCYTDSVRYNHPTPEFGSYSNAGHIMDYFVSTTDPRVSGNFLANKWTDPVYAYTKNTNPVVVSAQPTGSMAGHNALQTRGLNNGLLSAVEPYGLIYVRVDGATHTLQQIYDAVVAEGFIYSCSYSSSQNTFFLVGCLQFGSTLSLSIVGTILTIIGGEIGGTNQAGVSLNTCLINLIPQLSQPYINITSNGSIIANNSNSNGISGIQNGVGNYYYGSPLISGLSNVNYTNLANGGTILANLLTDLNVIGTGSAVLMQSSYGGQIWKRNKMPSNYYTLVNSAVDYEPNVYMMEDCEIFKMGGISWHYRFYQYPAQDGKYNIVKFLNIDTDNPDNIKQCINNRQINMNASWWRRLEFNFIDLDDLPVQNVSVSVVDGVGNIYSGTSDVNGYCYVDVVEQRTIFTQAMGIISTWTGAYDTYYSDYDIAISKTGYENISLFIEEARDLKKQDITIKPIVAIRKTTDGKLLKALKPESGSSAKLLEL